MEGPFPDTDGSQWNRLSLDARLGRMVKDHGLIISGEERKFWITSAGRNGPQDDLNTLLSTYDDAIRDAWNILYGKGDSK